jgi:hypothetical protein
MLSDNKIYENMNEFNSHNYGKEMHANDILTSPNHGYYEIQMESQEKTPMSPEPTILKPHVGDCKQTKQTIRERNLDEYWQDQSDNTLNPNIISSFLDNFDTSKIYSFSF